MKTETSIVARQYRLMEWAEQIRDCKARPSGMSVAEWCSMHDITTANYYYRFSQVRKACLEQVQETPVRVTKKTERKGRNITCGSIGSVKCIKTSQSSYTITNQRGTPHIPGSF